MIEVRQLTRKLLAGDIRDGDTVAVDVADDRSGLILSVA